MISHFIPEAAPAALCAGIMELLPFVADRSSKEEERPLRWYRRGPFAFGPSTALFRSNEPAVTHPCSRKEGTRHDTG